MKRLTAIVKGRVQGVGFRAFVKNKASSIGLKGYAKNLPDYSVEVVVEGSEEKLVKLLSMLEKGPILSRVDEVAVEWGMPLKDFRDFSIRH